MDTSEEPTSQASGVNSVEVEEKEDGGHATGGTSHATSQYLFETPPQSSQSWQSSVGEPAAGERNLRYWQIVRPVLATLLTIVQSWAGSIILSEMADSDKSHAGTWPVFEELWKLEEQFSASNCLKGIGL
ncbi:hypothetical protein UY3_01152 [Chelonia mydas]|uniref:Uncharacterized protein n=1 Tax=Chelonia mydas TaxID=8469 RepID=M7CKL8_CHEMY|nr:hypothetical protein UY3_01152 [Chelonia mydas]